MRDDFGIFILTHRRADRLYTVGLLERSGYTGKWWLVLDDEDPTRAQYEARHPGKVIVFGKSEQWSATDDADNTGDRRGVVYARNACWDIARRLGLRFFMQLDDDYTGFYLRFNSALTYASYRIKRRLDDVLEAMVEWLDVSGALTVAMSQGGDHIGGGEGAEVIAKRKAMNTFICATDRPFRFLGKINEDTTAYVHEGRRGGLFFGVQQAQVNQVQTQQNSGGLTEIYLDAGTYLKSFLSVMWDPSCVKVSTLGDPRAAHMRIHHWVDWGAAVPCIIPERFRKEA